jgi:hypothetical protein
MTGIGQAQSFSSHDDIASEIAKVRSLIDAACTYLDSGNGVDLTPLEGRVESLCGIIRKAPNGEARRYAGPLQEIIMGLDRLTTALNQQFQTLAQRAKDISPEQATNAYRKAES